MPLGRCTAHGFADAYLDAREGGVVPINRLYAIGCTWGCVLVMLWKAWAGFEGILATRRLGYGCSCLPMAALGLALAWQTKICYHHSCESDLFQVRPRTQGHLCVPQALMGANLTGVLRLPFMRMRCQGLRFADCGMQMTDEQKSPSPPWHPQSPTAVDFARLVKSVQVSLRGSHRRRLPKSANSAFESLWDVVVCRGRCFSVSGGATCTMPAPLYSAYKYSCNPQKR